MAMRLSASSGTAALDGHQKVKDGLMLLIAKKQENQSGDVVELPKRKQIRLQKYDYAQNGAYFVTICTYERRLLFDNCVGATLCGRPQTHQYAACLMIEKWLLEIENKFMNVIIDKYIIMPNHIHAILFFSGDHTGSPLPKIIDWFKTMTTNDYINNVKNNQLPPFDKHIWQRNYFDHIIRNDEDYLRIWQYIDNNPAKWAEDKYFFAEQ